MRISYFRLSLIMIIIGLLPSVLARATSTPTFTGGHNQTLNVCQNPDPNAIDSLLRINDGGVGYAETWTLVWGAYHGTVAPTTYVATSTGGAITPTGMNYTPAAGYTGIDSFRFAVSNGINSDSTTVHVNVIRDPNVGMIVGPSTVCTGQSVTLADTPSGAWSTSNSLAVCSSSGVLTGMTPGVDTVYYSVSNLCGLIQALQIVTINLSPAMGPISGPDTTCVGSVVSVFDSVTTGVWSASNPLDTLIFGVVEAHIAGIDTIRYTTTNASCTSVATHLLTILPVPHVSMITGSSTICQGAVATLADSVSGGIWTAVNLNAAVSGPGIVTGLLAGWDTISYTFTNICGTSTSTFPVTISPLPVVNSIYGASLLCVTNAIVLTDSTLGGTWTALAPSVATVASSGVVVASTAGIDTVLYSMTNDCGTVSAIHVLTVNAVPVAAAIAGSDTLCVGTTTTFTDASAGGLWRLTNFNGSVTGNVVTAYSVGPDTLFYTITNNCGADSTYQPLSLITTLSAGAIYGLVSICPKDTVVLYDTTLGGTWTMTDTLLARIEYGAGDSLVVKGIAPGGIIVSYSMTNICGTTVTTFSVSIGDSILCPNEVRSVTAPTGLLTLFPNPSSRMLALQTNQKISVVVFTDLTGKTVLTLHPLATSVEADLSGLAPGLYFVRAETATGSLMGKVVKE